MEICRASIILASANQTDETFIRIHMMINIRLVDEQNGLANHQERCKNPLVQSDCH